jgi:hypothetical protein
MAAEVQGSGFVARIHGAQPPDGNEDVHVTLEDGREYSGVLATLDGLQTLMHRWARTGECAGGRYVWISHLVIVRDWQPATIAAAIEELIRKGEIERAFLRVKPG